MVGAELMSFYCRLPNADCRFVSLSRRIEDRSPTRIQIGNWQSALLQAVRFITAQRKILAQRVSLPILRQQNAAQIRMPIKNDAKHVERLALVPVCRLPNAGDGRH